MEVKLKIQKVKAGLRILSLENIKHQDIAEILNLDKTSFSKIINGRFKNHPAKLDLIESFIDNKLSNRYNFDIDKQEYTLNSLNNSKVNHKNRGFDAKQADKTISIMNELIGFYRVYYFTNSKKILRCSKLKIEKINNEFDLILKLPQITYFAGFDNITFFEKNRDLQIDFSQDTDVLHLTAHLSLGENLKKPQILFGSFSLLSADSAPIAGLMIIIRQQKPWEEIEEKNIIKKNQELSTEEHLIWDFYDKINYAKTFTFRNIQITSIETLRDYVSSVSKNEFSEANFKFTSNTLPNSCTTLYENIHLLYLDFSKNVKECLSAKAKHNTIRAYVPTMYYMWDILEPFVNDFSDFSVEIGILNFNNQELTCLNPEYEGHARKSYEKINNYISKNKDNLNRKNISISVFLYDTTPINTGVLLNDDFLYATNNFWNNDKNLKPGIKTIFGIEYKSDNQIGKYYIELFKNWFEFSKNKFFEKK